MSWALAQPPPQTGRTFVILVLLRRYVDVVNGLTVRARSVPVTAGGAGPPARSAIIWKQVCAFQASSRVGTRSDANDYTQKTHTHIPHPILSFDRPRPVMPTQQVLRRQLCKRSPQPIFGASIVAGLRCRRRTGGWEVGRGKGERKHHRSAGECATIRASARRGWVCAPPPLATTASTRADTASKPTSLPSHT